MRKHISTILLSLILITGLSLLLYPTVSDYWNSFHQSRAVASYTEEIANLDNEQYEAILTSAREYNQALWGKTNRYLMTDEEREEYMSELNFSGSGVMGYIKIPKIDESLTIYHGTDEAVLQVAVGHVEGSSLPVGGLGTHTVLSGHRGLPSAKLFTDLDKMELGDTFILNILDETLTYEVDQIRIVLPEEMNELELVEGKDYCTLVTCTPYGVNSHRMLVRGHRVDNVEEAKEIRVSADALIIEPLLIAPFVAMPILFILFIWLLVRYHN